MEYNLKIQLDRIEEKLDIIAGAVFEDVDEENSGKEEQREEKDGTEGRPEYEQE